MPNGRIIKLVHLSQQAHLLNVRLVSDHNDMGYGIIQDGDGREVYCPYETVDDGRGFNELRKGQHVVFELENAVYLRARSVIPGFMMETSVAGPGSAASATVPLTKNAASAVAAAQPRRQRAGQVSLLQPA